MSSDTVNETPLGLPRRRDPDSAKPLATFLDRLSSRRSVAEPEPTGDLMPTIGETLRAARNRQARTIADVAGSLRTSNGRVEAIERDDFDYFGSDVYAMGFIRQYATEVGVPVAALLDQYRAENKRGARVPQGLVASRSADLGPLPSSSVGTGAIATVIGWAIALVFAIGGVVLVGWWLQSDRGAEPAPITAPPPPAVAEPAPLPVEPEPAEPEVVAAPTDVQLKLTFERDSWMRVRADGETVTEFVARAGQEHSYEADATLEVRFGNPAAVTWSLHDGDPVQLEGASPVTLTWGPEGIVEPS